MKKPVLILVSSLMILTMVLSACSPRPPAASIERSNLARVANPQAAPTDVEQLVAGNNAFALELYRSFRSSGGNLFYSPYSISLALAMTYAGARGDTAAQMAATLHYTLPQDQLHPAFDALDLQLAKQAAGASGENKDQQDFELNIANSLWGQKSWKFLQTYLDLLAQNYGAGMNLVDFENAAESARQTINAWVAEQTKDKIKDLIPQGALDELTRLVLVNAIYFKAGWQVKFDPNITADGKFNLPSGNQVSVPMMSFGEPESLKYGQGDGWQAVSLPYEGGTAEMVILLPEAGKFDSFEQGLDSARLEQILGSMDYRSVELTLPKFSFTDEHSLKDTLSSLGMPLAFDSDNADFSGMDGERDLYISEVIHKAFVAVDEKGTEAAAATAVILEAMALHMSDVKMKVDRPFIFFIRDIPSGSILFAGRVLDPSK